MNNQILNLKQTISQLLQNIIKRIDEIYEENISEESNNSERIVFLIDDLKTLADGINVINEDDNNFDLDEYNEKLTMLLEALTNNDELLLGDILVYELKPLLEHWLDIISTED